MRLPMKLSIYTFVKDGIYHDFHVVAMLRHHLPLADEIIVNEGHSSDSTFQEISAIGDPKIQIVRNHWDRSDPRAWHRRFKDDARRMCSGDWCLLLDCDEFIPEWHFDDIRRHVESTSRTVIPVSYLHFYGNYQVVNGRPEACAWPLRKAILHRNLPDMEVWGDGGEVRRAGSTDAIEEPDIDIVCHHFGYVRNPARLRQKWRTQVRQYRDGKWDKLPGFVFDLSPFDWFDPQFLGDLELYRGPFVEAVRREPSEFVRDDNRLVRFLERR